MLLNVVVGILADRFPLTFDLTKDKTFSLSEQGAAVADSIQKDVQITVFADESLFNTPNFGDERDTILRQFYQLTREYGSRTGGKVKVSYVDLTANPNLESQYVDYGNELTTGSILFEAGDRHQMIQYSDLFDVQQSSTSMAGYTVTSLVEQKLASCLNAVASENQTCLLYTSHLDRRYRHRFDAPFPAQSGEQGRVARPVFPEPVIEAAAHPFGVERGVEDLRHKRRGGHIPDLLEIREEHLLHPQALECLDLLSGGEQLSLIHILHVSRAAAHAFGQSRFHTVIPALS